jgi:hypothetical protein
VKRALLVLLAACDPQVTDPPWQLDHDRIVAARAEPPHIAPGEIALLDALVAHAGGPTTIERALHASAPNAPAGLFTAVHFFIDHWRVDGPDETALAAARAELGLAPSAAVPLVVHIEVPGELIAQKTVWLGDRHANPPAPAFTLPALGLGDVALDHDVPPGWSVRWLASCGSLTGDATPHATLSLAEPCTGELALVVRDPAGGVAWQILPLVAQ